MSYLKPLHAVRNAGLEKRLNFSKSLHDCIDSFDSVPVW